MPRKLDLNALLLDAQDRDVVHIDEAHELDKQLQTGLYLAIDQRKLFIQGGKKPQAIPIADFSLLLSTTDEYRLTCLPWSVSHHRLRHGR